MKRKLRGMKRSEILLDFNLYRVDVPISGLAGARLSVIDIQPQGVERTILFVHSYAGCAETWERQINYFSRRYPVIAPALRGHGQSDPPFTRYPRPEITADLPPGPSRLLQRGHGYPATICAGEITFRDGEPTGARPGRLVRGRR